MARNKHFKKSNGRKSVTAKDKDAEIDKDTKMGRRYTGRKPNDIDWHAKSAQLLKDAASIPWSWATGEPIHRETLNSDTSRIESPAVLPGILTIRTGITPGTSSDVADPINTAATALYTDIRRELKSANQYEASDVIIYMTMFAEIVSMISWATRLYATSMLYSFGNNYLPDALFRAQGLDPSGFHKKSTEFRSRINQDIALASKIWVPRGFDYITRAKWLYANYYSEGESVKDQLYMYTPGFFRKFKLLESTDYAGALEPFVRITENSSYTWENVCEWLEAMIASVITDSDFNNIAGDLFNRYGASGVESFMLIPEDAIVSPVLSYEVLEQMQNSHCCTAVQTMFEYGTDEAFNDLFSVKQDETNNMLIVSDEFHFTAAEWIEAYNQDWWNNRLNRIKSDAYAPLLTIDKDPSDAKTMLITRDTNYMIPPFVVSADSNVLAHVTAAAEWVLSYAIWYFDTNRQLRVIKFESNHPTTPEPGAGQSDLEFAAWLSNFHYHPLVYVHNSGSFTPLPGVIGSMDIVAPIDAASIKDLNRVDLLSLFAVPDVGKVSKY